VAGRMSAIDFTLANPGAPGRNGALAFADSLGKQGFMDTYYKQISPKFGFAYAATNKIVLRGGYGINNTPAISNGFGFGGTQGYNGSISVTSANTSIPFAEAPLGNWTNPYPSFTGTLPLKNPALVNGQGIDWYPANSNQLPYVQNWNFGLQYQMPAQTVLEVNYVANKGTRLIARGFQQPNNVPFSAITQYGDLLPRPWSASSPIPAPYAGFVGTNLQALRPYPQFTGINSIFPNVGSSSYQGLQMQVTRHFSKGLAVLGAYTWSKTIGLGDSALDAEGVALRAEQQAADQLLAALESAPDAFVLTDSDGRVLSANRAFLDLAQLGSKDQARAQSLEKWLGRAGVDLRVLLSSLRQHGAVRLYATVLRGEFGSTADVEISASAVTEGEAPCLGFTIRDVGRRLMTSRASRELPRSASQMTELVGRLPLRDIVVSLGGV